MVLSKPWRLVLVWGVLVSSAALARERPAGGEFHVPPALAPQVEFWKDVFTRYSRWQTVIHDTEDLRRVYSVLDFRDLKERGESDAYVEQVMSQAVKRERERIRALLLRLHGGGAGAKGLAGEEQRIAEMFRTSADPRKFLRAAEEDRVRSQTGLRERFAAGIETAHRYFPDMERILEDEGVPIEITRLPLIESCFNVRAYSKAGAAGVWQFIPSTGRLYMTIDDAVDERRDPIFATRAAARYLRKMYDDLGAWPLAITAYNHGPAGIERAVNKLGTRDITRIIQSYRGPAFKFASRNFYPEFLAALEVERNASRYFGPLNLQRPVGVDVVRIKDYVDLDTVAAAAGVSPETIAELNPSLSRAVYDGKLRIPRGHVLRLPAGKRDRFERQYAALPADRKFGEQRRAYVAHRVERGQTLHTIARRYGRSVEQIRRHNNIRKAGVIRVGQVLRIPSS